MYEFYKGHTPVSWEELLEMNLWKSELPVKFGFDNVSYDTAIPIDWLYSFCEKYDVPRNKVTYSCFMIYDDNHRFGKIISVLDEIHRILELEEQTY